MEVPQSAGERRARAAARPAPGETPRIVALTHRVPYPPDKGDKIRTHHLLTRLARRAEVHLACLADPPEDAAHAEHLRAHFASVAVVPVRMALQKLAALPHLATLAPLTLPAFHSPALARAVDALVARVRPTALYAESSSMAPYALRHPAVPLVMDFVDVDSEKWRALAARGFPLKRLLLAREALLLARYERRVAAHAAVSTVTAPRELELLGRVAPGARARVLANGVDTEYFTPRATLPREPAVVFAGAMDYAANVEAAVFLAGAVLPRLRRTHPAASVVLAGARPVPEVLALAREPGVTVTGTVPDIRPWVTAARASACPLRVARGVQNKVLEAMALGVPVVASPGAAAGIDAEPGRDLLLATMADDGAAFATALARLLDDDARCEALARSARARVEERYGWQPRADELYELLREAGGGYSVRR
jgi:sugar transferase (PEP-CTERM/EpsH1 system associated)